MRIMLVVNSFASSVTARNTVLVHRRLEQGHHVEVVDTNRRGHATRFATDAARRGFDVVVGFGGDGTLNEVATGIAGTDVALGVLPGGSTNVFARTLGMPNDPLRAVELLAGGIDAGTIERIGLGRADGRFFCFHTGIGFDAAVVEAVERHATLKRWLGHPLFISASLTTWFRGYDRSTPHFSVTSPDHGSIDDAYFSIVLNTNPYTYLGNRPFDLSPAAALDRSLVVVSFRELAVGAFLRGVGAALRGGGVATSDTLVEWRDVSTVRVEKYGDQPFPFQLDGDYLGEVDALDLAYEPAAVNLVIPRVSPDAPGS